MRSSPKLLLLTLLAVAASNAIAAGDPSDGAKKAAVCGGCHGPKGISVNPLWPNLAGQHAQYLATQIRAYRDGIRSEATMQPFVMNLTDQDAEDLAAYFSVQRACQ